MRSAASSTAIRAQTLDYHARLMCVLFSETASSFTRADLAKTAVRAHFHSTATTTDMDANLHALSRRTKYRVAELRRLSEIMYTSDEWQKKISRWSTKFLDAQVLVRFVSAAMSN